MMTQPSQVDFEIMPITKCDIPRLLEGSYRVYKSYREYVVVSAESALEALQLSGLDNVHKIERESMDNISVLSASAWHEKKAVPANLTGQPAEKKDTILVTVPESMPPAAAEPPQELSDDEVNKLLKN
jgi:hypothetical protein